MFGLDAKTLQEIYDRVIASKKSSPGGSGFGGGGLMAMMPKGMQEEGAKMTEDDVRHFEQLMMRGMAMRPEEMEEELVMVGSKYPGMIREMARSEHADQFGILTTGSPYQGS